MDKKRLLRSPLVWIAVVLVLYLMYSYFADDTRGYVQQNTSVALAQLKDGNVTEATIDDKEQRLRLTVANAVDGNTKIFTNYPAAAGEQIFDDVQAANVSGGYNTVVTSESTLFSLLIYLIPVGLIILFLLWMMNNAQGGGNRVLSFGKSKAKLLTKDMPQTKFTDVAGADEAVQELDEIRDFLQNPARYQALGAKIPKGVLLYGPPGTGKTLLARAVAGEAGVPFYTISGSDFVEMFVGVGARRVRDLFEQAKANAPAIIFVDEIDAVGRHRGAGMGGGHDEREQTLNQLLVEMDGFEAKGGIILIAATNRPDILDPALLRPGRFDRQIPVGQPDLKGRQAILAVHANGKPFAPDVDFLALAKRTVGMSGADLANVINEAALLTAREHGTVITDVELEESVDRVVGGPAAQEPDHHRAGEEDHRLPRGRARAGRVGDARAGTGVQGDDPAPRAHRRARPGGARGRQVADDPLGNDRPVGHGDGRPGRRGAGVRRTDHGGVVGHRPGHQDRPGDGHRVRHVGQARRGQVRARRRRAVPRPHLRQRAEYSIEVGSEIDGEVRALIETAHTEAWAVLNTYRDVLDALAGALLEKETLERRDLEVIFAEVEKRPRITAFDEFGQRLPSDRPPIKTPGELAIERGEPWPPPPPVGPDLSKPTQPRPVPVGVAADYPGQAGYNTPKPDPQLTQHQQAPPNWTGGVLPGPLGPYDPGPQGRPANGNQPNGAPPNGGPHGGPHGGSPHGQPPTGHRGQAGWGQTPPPPPTGPVDPHDPWAPPRDRRS